MPKSKTEVVKANGNQSIIETAIGKDYRVTIPTQIRRNFDPTAKYRITFDKIME